MKTKRKAKTMENCENYHRRNDIFAVDKPVMVYCNVHDAPVNHIQPQVLNAMDNRHSRDCLHDHILILVLNELQLKQK